jgi:hypothetical protein
MKRSQLAFAVLALVAIQVSALAQDKPEQQTARDYFNELRDAGEFQKYLDKYVCFKDEASPSFAILSSVDDAADALRRNGQEKSAKVVTQAGHGLFVQGYYKGVSSGEPLFYENQNGGYQLDFDSPFNGREIYLVNWTTGRYRQLVYVFKDAKYVLSTEADGKCELIHPGDTPSLIGARR